MARFLFVTFDGGGNVPTMISLATEIVKRGHTVVIISHPNHDLTASGLTVDSYVTARSWDPRGSSTTLGGAFHLASTLIDVRLASDVVVAISQHQPDVIVVDCMLVGVCARLNRERLPYTTVFHTLYSYWYGPFRTGPLGAACRLRGLGDPRQIWEGSKLQLVCTDTGIDPPPQHVRDSAKWVGPTHDVSEAAQAIDGRPRLLVSLSTVGYPGLTSTLKKIIHACSGLACDVVVTTGPAVTLDGFTPPANTTLLRYVPHHEIMPTCTGVISHGGHSTAMRALAHGLPVLVVPMHPLIDQPLVGQAIVRSGAGLLTRRHKSPAMFRRSITRLLNDPELATTAAAIGERLRARNGSTYGADLLEDQIPNPLR